MRWHAYLRAAVYFPSYKDISSEIDETNNPLYETGTPSLLIFIVHLESVICIGLRAASQSLTSRPIRPMHELRRKGACRLAGL